MLCVLFIWLLLHRVSSPRERVCVYTKHTPLAFAILHRLYFCLYRVSLTVCRSFHSYMQWKTIHLVLRFWTKIQCNKPNVFDSYQMNCFTFNCYLESMFCLENKKQWIAKNNNIFYYKMERSNSNWELHHKSMTKKPFMLLLFFSIIFIVFLSSLYFSLFCCLFLLFYFITLSYGFSWGITSYW